MCSSDLLIAEVLRGEWGFDGAVISDWYGLHSTVDAALAGVDLEMPGPTRHRGAQLREAVERGDVPMGVLRERARKVLELAHRTGALAADKPGPETARREPDDLDLVRRAAAQGMVLLQNRQDATGRCALPLSPSTVRRIAVIGDRKSTRLNSSH